MSLKVLPVGVVIVLQALRLTFALAATTKDILQILKKTIRPQPVRSSLRTLNVSISGVRIPSMVPNMLPRPRLTSMRKNMTDQKGEAGK